MASVEVAPVRPPALPHRWYERDKHDKGLADQGPLDGHARRAETGQPPGAAEAPLDCVPVVAGRQRLAGSMTSSENVPLPRRRGLVGPRQARGGPLGPAPLQDRLAPRDGPLRARGRKRGPGRPRRPQGPEYDRKIDRFQGPSRGVKHSFCVSLAQRREVSDPLAGTAGLLLHMCNDTFSCSVLMALRERAYVTMPFSQSRGMCFSFVCSGIRGIGRYMWLEFKTYVIAGMMYLRLRYVLWLMVVVGVVGFIVVGNADAGTYAGYAAGSFFDPERYEDTMWTSRYGDYSGLKAADVNAQLSAMRNKAVPRLAFFGMLAIFASLLAYAAMRGWENMEDFIKEKQQQIPGLKDYLDKICAREAPRRKAVVLGDISLAEQDRCFCAVEYLCQPDVDGGIAGTPVSASLALDARALVRRKIATKLFLLLNGLWQDAAGHIVALPLPPSLSLPLPVVDDAGAGMAVQPPVPSASTAHATGTAQTTDAAHVTSFCPSCGHKLIP